LKITTFNVYSGVTQTLINSKVYLVVVRMLN